MAKKSFLVVFIIASLVFGSFVWAAASAPKQKYPSGTELYPAVYGTFAELYPKAKYANIDFYNNSYTLTGITGMALTTPLSYDMTVRLTGSGEIDISYSNLYSKDTTTGKWSKAKAFGLYNYNKAVSNITTKMLAIANDSADLARAEKAAMADIVFVYTIMEKFTDLAFKDFIEKYAKGSVFVLEGPVSDVKESNKEINGGAYKYLVTMNKSLIEDDELFSALMGKTIYCRFYTNRDDVIRYSKTSVIKVSAVLISAFKGSSGSLSLDLAANE
ncbi:MAG: hypothetical protein LBB89_08710 [Treponema sp.]|jgi:hypothetical protein|nr:hypothetical protein [Treponema sp.]